MLKLLAAPVAGAAALMACALLVGIDPLASAIIGALVWAGTELIWGPTQARLDAEPRRPLSSGQRGQLDAAMARIDRIDAIASQIGAARVADGLAAIARRAAAMVARLQSDPGAFELYRKALGNYLAQAETLGVRVRDAETTGRADPETVARLGASFDRLEQLFAAVEDRGAAMDRLDLDARIVVLEGEIDADLAPGKPRPD